MARITRAPRWVRVLAPLSGLAGSVVLYLAFDIGAPSGNVRVQFGSELAATVHSEHPVFIPIGFALLALSAACWLWDAASSD